MRTKVITPVREARRQAHLRRMRQRVEYFPTYHDTYNGKGELVASRYLGHVEVPMRGVFQGVLTDKYGRHSRFAPLSANMSKPVSFM